jgi:flagellar hook-associated protein 1
MSDLLQIGASAARAYGAALRTVGENVANADDPNYVRRTLTLREAASAGAASPLYAARVNADGVSIGGVARQADPIIDGALRSAQTELGRASVRSDWLTRAEDALGDSSTAVGTRLTAFFDAGTRLAASPLSPERRIDMLAAAGSAVDGINDTAARLAALGADNGSTLTSTLTPLNAALTDLAAINARLRGAVPGSAGQAQLLDRRDAALTTLADMAPIDVTFGPQGMASVAVGGVMVVDGITANAVTAITRAGDLASLSVTGSATSATVSGGSIGGLASAGARIAALATDLDTLAADFATAINGFQANGRTPANAAGAPLLSGASAATLTLLTMDPAAIAAADAAGQANGNLNAIARLRGAGGAESGWTTMVHTLATQLNTARADSDASAAIADQAASRRDALSGVDLDREASEMLRLQQAYDAAARVLQVARETMQSILNIF